MRRWSIACAVFALVLPGGGAPARPAAADPKPGGFMSQNVTWVATIPLDAPAIGGRVLQVGAQRRFYLTGTKGLTIYDVTLPRVPVVIGTLALPHFENESVAVSDDGSTVLITSDPGFAQPSVTYVIDTSLVHVPRVASVIKQGSHTVSCANVACSHVYANAGWIYDIRDRYNPKPAGNFRGASHYLSRDASGLLSDGSTLWDPRKDPARPVARRVGTGGWHNSLRPNAEKWRPRRPGDTSPYLRPGELHIGSNETWLSPGKCNARSAGISTWGMADFDKGVGARYLDSITPRNGNFDDGNPPVDVVGCSAHWFDYRKGIVAAGWYDHGIRFIGVNERTGKLAEVGYFQPVATEAWAAYWVDDTTVYGVDAARGIDILAFDRTAKPPAAVENERSWQRPLFGVSPATRREQLVCWLAGQES